MADCGDNSRLDAARRAQLRHALELSVRERLQALEYLTEVNDKFAAMREQGKMTNARGEAMTQSTQEPEAHYDGEAVTLAGCSPIPLSNYLKALGAMRLVAETPGGDPAVRGYWQGERFHLRCEVDERAVVELFLHAYRPSPVVAPWNGGSGFYPKDNQDGIGPLAVSTAQRFQPLRDAIVESQAALAEHQLTVRPAGPEKYDLLADLRGRLSDQALGWLDAAVVLTDEHSRFPPLLGTGGNDGRLDFTNNFMQRLVELFDPASGEPRRDTEALLRAALFGESVPGLASAAVGQFAPGAAGGPNADTGFEAGSVVNPWDFVLMLEGAILFASAVTRRLESGSGGAASYPFTVIPLGSGSGAVSLADESTARAEMWLPLWAQPATLPELRALLGEGRATHGRRTARDSLDFARAVSKLGVNRGIDAFQRYAFHMRSGKAYLATPLARFRVERNPDADLIQDLDRGGWLGRFRRAARQASGRAQQLVRQLEDALFEFTQYPRRNDEVAGQSFALRVQKILLLLGRIERYLAASPGMRESCPPVPPLSAEWVARADDGTAEFRIAAALASLSSEPLSTRLFPAVKRRRPPQLRMAAHIAPVHPGDHGRWFEDSRLVTWTDADLLRNLADTLQRRLVDAERWQLTDKPLAARFGCDLRSLGEFLVGNTDDRRINELVPALALCATPRRLSARRADTYWPVPLPYMLLKPLFSTDHALRAADLLADGERLRLDRELPRLLAAGRVDEAVARGVQRLRSAGVQVPNAAGAGFAYSGPRLLAALTIPIAIGSLESIARRTTPDSAALDSEASA